MKVLAAGRTGCCLPGWLLLWRSVASMVMVKMEWERELSWFIKVAPTTRFFLPTWQQCKTQGAEKQVDSAQHRTQAFYKCGWRPKLATIGSCWALQIATCRPAPPANACPPTPVASPAARCRSLPRS